MVFQEDIAVFLQMLRKHIKKKVIKIPATLLKYRKMQFVIVSLNKSIFINISKFEKHCSCVLIETKRPRRSICRGLELIFKLQLHMYVYFLKLSYWDTYVYYRSYIGGFLKIQIVFFTNHRLVVLPRNIRQYFYVYIDILIKGKSGLLADTAVEYE